MCGGEALLELFEHGVTSAFRGNAKGAEAGDLHRGQELGWRRGRREIRRVELNAEVATRDCFAHTERVTRRGVERRIDKIEVMDSCSDFQLFDFVRDELGIARTVSPAFNVPVRAIDAFVHAAALRLDRNRSAMTLITSEIDPAMESGSR